MLQKPSTRAAQFMFSELDIEDLWVARQWHDHVGDRELRAEAGALASTSTPKSIRFQ